MTTTDDTRVPARLSDLLRTASASLAAAGVPTPDVDAELLAAHVLGVSRGALAAAALRGDELPEGEVARLGGVV
jgi:release factor glutamine methyltransferase